MLKRISCRVVSSVPLGRSSALRYVSQSNDRHSGIGNAVAADAGRPGNSVVYTAQLRVAGEFSGDGLVGRILDCYA